MWIRDNSSISKNSSLETDSGPSFGWPRRLYGMLAVKPESPCAGQKASPLYCQAPQTSSLSHTQGSHLQQACGHFCWGVLRTLLFSFDLTHHFSLQSASFGWSLPLYFTAFSPQMSILVTSAFLPPSLWLLSRPRHHLLSSN